MSRSGTGHVTATLPITWGDVKSSNCLAMLKPKSSEDEVIVEFRRLRPRTGCRRSSVFTAAPGARIFTSLNLAAFGLVASGAAGKSRGGHKSFRNILLQKGLHLDKTKDKTLLIMNYTRLCSSINDLHIRAAYTYKTFLLILFYDAGHSK